MSKFKVGDRVRVKTFSNRTLTWNTEGKMDKWMGKTVTIQSIEGSMQDSYRIKEEPRWLFGEDNLEPIEPKREFIVIRRDGNETIAELRHGREVVKSAKARCMPSDTFDFLKEGAPRAFDRLVGREEPSACRYGFLDKNGMCVTGFPRPFHEFKCIREKCKAHRDYVELNPQPAPRFKVGDRVVIKEELRIAEHGKKCLFTRGMMEYAGKSATVLEIDSDGDMILSVHPRNKNGRTYYFDSSWVEPDLSPAPEPKYYSGKVFAVRMLKRSDCDAINNRIGHVFEIKDGVAIGDSFWANDLKHRTFSDFCKLYSNTKWAEVKE